MLYACYDKGTGKYIDAGYAEEDINKCLDAVFEYMRDNFGYTELREYSTEEKRALLESYGLELREYVIIYSVQIKK